GRAATRDERDSGTPPAASALAADHRRDRLDVCGRHAADRLEALRV
ncbi:MAG: hypothetical protein AVDCRST_MAG18-2597, partial [uncultured Thermomicrobiales bacterium]